MPYGHATQSIPMTHSKARLWLSALPLLMVMILGAALLLLSASVWSSEEGGALNMPLAASGILLLLIGAVALAFLKLRG